MGFIPAVASGVGAFLATSVGTTTIGGILANIGGSLVLGFVSQRLSSRRSTEQTGTERLSTIRSTVDSRRIVYGRAKVSGTVLFIHVSNPLLYIAMGIASHELEEIEQVFFDTHDLARDGNNRATGQFGPPNNLVFVDYQLGLDGQSANQRFVSEIPDKITQDHKFSGISYLAFKMLHTDDFASGLPQITAIIKGAKLFDPRTSTTAYSDNSALAVLDYMRNSRYGLGISDDDIDLESFKTAANICDESVAKKDGGTEARYTCNGSFDLSERPSDILDKLLSSMAGILTFTSGKWTIRAGSFVAAVKEFDEDDARGPIHVLTKVSRRENFNAVKGIYISEDNEWQPTDFPEVKNSFYAAQDGGDKIFADIELPFTTSSSTAQRIAKILLEKARQPITVNFPAKLSGLSVVPGDVIQLTNTRFGWSQKLFEVMEWALVSDSGIDEVPSIGVDLVLRETAAEVYDWDPDADETTVDPAPNTNLPSPLNVPEVTGLALEGGTSALLKTGDGTIIPRIKVSWNTYPDPQSLIEIQWKLSSDTVYQNQTTTQASQNSVFISPVNEGSQYDVRVRAVNSLGIASGYTEITGFTVLGKSERPPDVPTLFIANGILSWSYPNKPADFAGFEVRTNPGNDSFWASAQKMHSGLITETEFDASAVQPGLRTFMVKAFDTSGNESQNPAVLVKDLGDVLTENIVRTIDLKALGWPGVIVNGSVNLDGDLEADTETLLFWSGVPLSRFWTDPGALFWGVPPPKEMVYTASFIPETEDLPAILKMDLDVAAISHKVEYRTGSQSPFWTGNQGAIFWTQ